MLGTFRAKLDLKTRRKKQRTASQPVIFKCPDGSLQISQMPHAALPLYCVGFNWNVPGILRGQLIRLAQFWRPDRCASSASQIRALPNQHGEKVPGCLCEASVLESTKEVFGTYRLATGEHITATCPISDTELAAYSKYPDTFFGEVRQAPRSSKTLVELCDFFYDTYKDTPRKTLLEWLADAPDFEHLKMLSQKDLAIIICERWAIHGFNEAHRKRAS